MVGDGLTAMHVRVKDLSHVSVSTDSVSSTHMFYSMIPSPLKVWNKIKTLIYNLCKHLLLLHNWLSKNAWMNLSNDLVGW